MDAQPKSRASEDRERNAELLEGVLASSGALLRRQARRHAELPEDAEDALSSACVLFIERYRGDCEPLAWLQTTVKREAWRMRRRASRRREVSLDAPCAGVGDGQAWIEAVPCGSPGPCERVLGEAELREREALLGELKPDERRALVLFGMGFSYAEICEICSWSYTKVNRCIAEGRAALRSRLTSGEKLRLPRP
ncbi:MAG: sigma factor-like helix-turn-helix DNA-binding protein [Solirubrobacterales bacterium]